MLQHMSLDTPVSARVNRAPECDLDGRWRYLRPADVLFDPTIDSAEKREVLSCWASDACAVESTPALRHMLDTPAPVPFDEIISALTSLDGLAHDRGSGTHRGRRTFSPRFGYRRSRLVW